MARVRRADVRAERAELVSVLIREVEDWVDESRFDWLYLDNPVGEARCWVLDDGGEIVGISTAFPRQFRAAGRDVKAWVLGDFCVSRRLRSLGPAMQLQRAAFDAVNEGEVDVWYDFPNEPMLAVYRRMGTAPTRELVRMVYLLKADGLASRHLGDGVVAKALGFAGNVLLSTRSAFSRRDPSMTLSRSNNELDAAGEPGFMLEDGVWLRRTSDYVNWRYRDFPGEPPSILTASGGGSIVFCQVGDSIEIVDLFGVPDERTLKQLLLAVVDEARKRAASGLTFALSSDHPWIGFVRELGFRDRDTKPFVVFSGDSDLGRSMRWFLVGGDRDLW